MKKLWLIALTIMALMSINFAFGQAPVRLGQGPLQGPYYLIGPWDLTGTWYCDDGGTYYIRQMGNEIWWYGENDPNSPRWSNVMHGTISGNTIYGNWLDVPKGSDLNSGNINLNIESNNRLSVIQKTGGFGGSVWTR